MSSYPSPAYSLLTQTAWVARNHRPLLSAKGKQPVVANDASTKGRLSEPTTVATRTFQKPGVPLGVGNSTRNALPASDGLISITIAPKRQTTKLV